MKWLLFVLFMTAIMGISLINSSIRLDCLLDDGDIYGRIECGDSNSWRFSILSQGALRVSTAGIKDDMVFIPDIEAGFFVFRVPILD